MQRREVRPTIKTSVAGGGGGGCTVGVMIFLLAIDEESFLAGYKYVMYNC